MAQSKLTYQLKKEDEELALRSLLRREFGVSTRLLRKLKDEERIFLDGKAVKAFEQGKKGQILEI
ncbi:MAG: RluA family pseudouridine synthase, partial [Firmicutes bacterium]|nr:RluA family pseudouridine synthase [Bacillota bacterium]